MHRRILLTALAAAYAFHAIIAPAGDMLSLASAQTPPPAESGATPIFKDGNVVGLSNPEGDTEAGCGPLSFFCKGQKLFGWVTQAIMYLILYIGGIIVTLSVGLINILIAMSSEVASSLLVQTGFTISLSIANLGFVLAIIFIGFGTMLRLHEYEMKKSIRNLIFAAVLVNFSFAITGVILDFTNILASFFIAKIGGGDGFFTSVNNFAANIASALHIQNLTNVRSFTQDAVGLGGAIDFAMSYLPNMLSIFLAVVFTILSAIVMFGIGLMLLVRYLYLTILLILMPLAWLCLAIPELSKYWQEWWHKFLQWTFFLPAVTFFLYLALFGANSLGEKIGTLKDVFADPALAVDAKIAQKNGLIGFLDTIIVLGLLTSALIAAQKLGIEGAGVAMQAADKVKGWAVGQVTSRVKVRATGLTRTQLGQNVASRLQQFSAGAAAKGTDFTIWKPKTYKKAGWAGVGAITKPARELGYATESGIGVKQGENLVKEAEANQKGFSPSQLAARIPDMQDHEKVAAFAKLMKDKNLDIVPNLATYMKGNLAEIFKAYGKEKEYKDLEKTVGFSREVLTAKSGDARTMAMDDFRKKLGIKDYDKQQGNLFGSKPVYGLTEAEHEEIRNLAARSIFNNAPGAISKIRAALKGDDLDQFQEDLDNFIDAFERESLPKEVREGSTKEKIKYIEREMPKKANLIRGWYNARKNFAGSLLGGSGDHGEEHGEGHGEEHHEEKHEAPAKPAGGEGSKGGGAKGGGGGDHGGHH
jgi:hypothetical protein